MKVEERFLKYIKINSRSMPDQQEVPSTEVQWDMARFLVNEMKAAGLQNVRLSDHCYVYGEIPATPGYESVAPIGFISHMDTAPDLPGENVTPQIIENYDGGDIALGNSGCMLTNEAFPHLSKLKGHTLITTDGSTLLGADNKAGISEILTAIEELLAEGVPHGKVCAAFTPDEEVGQSYRFFDVEGFGAKYGYTVDGPEANTITYCNNNSGRASLKIHGNHVHTGYAKGKLKNAALIACEFNSMLPAFEAPRYVEDEEGMYHLSKIEGTAAEASMQYTFSDFDSGGFEARKKTLRHIAKILNEKYGAGTIEIEIQDRFLNMQEVIRPCFEVVENAIDAIQNLGMEVVDYKLRGGTDGTRLSYMGLPSPNIGCGGYAAHTVYEHTTIERMEECVAVIKGIIREYAKSAE